MADKIVDGNMAVMPLRETVMFPRSIMPFFVGRPTSIQAIEAANATQGKLIFLVTQKDESLERPSAEDLYPVGTVCKILQVLSLPDGTNKILCEGLWRGVWRELHDEDGVLFAQVTQIPEIDEANPEKAALIRAVRESLEDFGASADRVSQETLLSIMAFREGGALADAIMPHLKVDFRGKQEVLELTDVSRRLERVYEHLEAEKALANVEKRIKNRVKDQLERNQREYYLTEQIKAINREMGREADPQAELLDLENALKERDMPEEAREKALVEVKKLRAMPPSAAEYTVSRNYVDWILALPWNAVKKIDIDIARARAILDGAHYGLDKVKERILEYLAVQKLSRGLKGPILCLVGPPGVGKTSLARSVAEATGREFARISLGGARDEAEIRGHRRTYVGALPGKLIQTLKRVKTNNPLFCLDEIDKLSSDYRGDPAAALLEALDPEQNATFMDHYLDIEYDLSKIFFIATANSLNAIPPPLLDRMEVIELPSYLETEKKRIARKFSLPRQLEEHGLRAENLRVSENAITAIIRRYTRESGVRDLERQIGALCRKTAVRLVEKNALHKRVNVNRHNLATFLGPQKYRHEESENEPQIGVCAGLAYTQSGGEILLVETGLMRGGGNVVTTGQLGEVMTESAKAALSYVRSRADALGLDPDFYRKIDLHVHVPAGATPKDGPSAGITLATSISSALLGIPARNDVAMTGEISLRGRVLPVGGLREKLLAAGRAGIKTVILPKANEKDIEEAPPEILNGLTLRYVEHVDEVLPIALAASESEIFSGTAKPLSSSLRAHNE